MLDFFDDLGRFNKLDSSTRFVRDRHMIQRASKINRERWTVEILAFCRVVDEVQNHPCPLHERQAKNSVDGDVWTCCDQERCVLPLGCLVGEVELEAHLQFGGDGFLLLGLDDTRQHDWRIILGGKYLR
jgi:hypothetical protein